MKLEGKVAFVTGGASGLGKAAVDILVKNGVRVGIADLNEELGNEVAKEYSEDQVIFIQTDVTDQIQVESAIKATVSKFSALHITINSAGVNIINPTLTKSKMFNFEAHKLLLDINVNGTIYSSAYSAKYMAQNEPEERGERGVIINLSSSLATQGPRGFVSYSASKGAVLGMTLPMARDLGRYGIRVLNIAPSLFRTPIMEGSGLAEEMASKTTPLGRIGEMDEFAQLVKTCVENGYLNGVSLQLTGGSIASYM